MLKYLRHDVALGLAHFGVVRINPERVDLRHTAGEPRRGNGGDHAANQRDNAAELEGGREVAVLRVLERVRCGTLR